MDQNEDLVFDNLYFCAEQFQVNNYYVQGRPQVQPRRGQPQQGQQCRRRSQPRRGQPQQVQPQQVNKKERSLDNQNGEAINQSYPLPSQIHSGPENLKKSRPKKNS